MPEVSRFLGIIIMLEWADEHREELMEDWNLARAEEPLHRTISIKL